MSNVKPKSFKQRMFEAKKAGFFDDNGLCICGGKIKERDHGSWTGWYCPKCGRGGSRQNSKYNKW